MNKLLKKIYNKDNLIYLFMFIYILFIFLFCNISHSYNYIKGYQILQNKNEISSYVTKKQHGPIDYAKNKNANYKTNKISIVYDKNSNVGYINKNHNVKLIKNLKKDKRLISYANTDHSSMAKLFCEINNKSYNIINICEINKSDIYKYKLKKIYLTFDDGPSPITNKVLDVLNKNNVKATFFFNASNSKSDAKVLKRIVNEGHLLGLHTYSHDYKKIYKSATSFIKDLERNRKNFKKITGYNCKIFRFPGGTNNTVAFAYGGKNIIKKSIKLSKKYGYDYVDWNAFPDDTSSYVSYKKYNIVLKQAKWNDEVVVLIHVFDRNKGLPKGLNNIIKDLKKQGYTFDTVDNLSKEIKFNPAN